MEGLSEGITKGGMEGGTDGEAEGGTSGEINLNGRPGCRFIGRGKEEEMEGRGKAMG